MRRGWAGGGWAPPSCLPCGSRTGEPHSGQASARVPHPLPHPAGPAPCPLGHSPAARPCPTSPRPSQSPSGPVLEAAQEGPSPLLPTSRSPTSACHLCICHSLAQGRGGAGGTGPSVCLAGVCLQFLVCVLSMPCAFAHSIAHSERPPRGVTEGSASGHTGGRGRGGSCD